MIISARNKIKGTIEKVEKGAVNASVVLKATGGDVITAGISNAAVDELGLAPGQDAVAIIKATDVMIGMGDLKISARNQLSGEVIRVEEGAVNAIVTVKIAGDDVVTSSISMAAVKELGLATGVKAKAVIKATAVMIGV